MKNKDVQSAIYPDERGMNIIITYIKGLYRNNDFDDTQIEMMAEINEKIEKFLNYHPEIDKRYNS